MSGIDSFMNNCILFRYRLNYVNIISRKFDQTCNRYIIIKARYTYRYIVYRYFSYKLYPI